MKIIQTFNDIVKKKAFSFYVIPSGSLTITNWFVGTQFKKNSSMKVNLFYVKDGHHNKKKKWVLLDTIYTKDGNYNKIFTSPIIITSLGNAEVAMEAMSLGGHGKREVFVKWVGEI